MLAAAGHRIPGRRSGPAGLTPREVEVLRLLARGLSNKQIAARLVISPKTVGNHVEHIYAKIGASNRAGAGLFAMQHGLLPEEHPAPDPGAGKMGQTPHAGRAARFLDWVPVQPKESEMLKVSRESAEHVEDHGPVEDRHQDGDGYTINFVTFEADVDGTPLLKGLPGDQLPRARTGAT